LDLKGYSFPHENKIRRKLGLDTSVLLTKSAKDERARRDERLLAPSKSQRLPGSKKQKDAPDQPHAGNIITIGTQEKS
jgi:hypothetical protein